MSDVIEVFDPGNRELLGTVPSASRADVEHVLATASEASDIARNLPTHLRISVLRQVAEQLQKRQEEFAETIAKEGIKTIREARQEVTRCIETLRISAEGARRLGGEIIAFDQVPGSENRFGYFKRLPIGVVVAITPYNDPLNLVAHKIGPAIAAGNAVILKPHSLTPLSARKLVELFDATELPAGVLQLITGAGAIIGDQLVSDPRVRMVSFTGGPLVGHKVLAQAGLKKISMELGSNCPTIVMGDADMELALAATVRGAFWAAGQNCLHVQRLFIQNNRYEAFSNRFVERTKRLKVGDKMDESTDMGPLISDAATLKVSEFVQDAVASGARILTGGECQGRYYQPTVLDNVSADCQMSKEEVFGPVVALYAFREIQEAIDLANNVDYGLQAGVFTRDLATAHRIADALDCGGVMINDSSDYRIDAMPFGGTRGSGLGREGVAHAIQEMTELKTYCFNL
ncbi:MAG: aldehyde dehydrogenase family protein [Proteobacteria bacterium]|nr:aldehyde dehydrogenase family protein [Pseudomonadota bacterium]